MNVENFIRSLSFSNWFSQVGQGAAFNESFGEPVKIISQFDDAVSIWQSDLENRCDQWEDLRIQLIENKSWADDFHAVRTKTWEALQVNSEFMKFAERVNRNLSFEPELFCSQLPVLGFWGESLLNLDNGYYKNQIVFFKHGFFVCGKDKDWIIY